MKLDLSQPPHAKREQGPLMLEPTKLALPQTAETWACGMRPVLLDLFCGAGGAARGYQRAGFYVVGVDHRPYSFYAGDEFICADAMEFPLDGFDAIHASPPCQHYSAMKHMPDAKDNPDLIWATRSRLHDAGVPYVIENVVGAPLVSPVLLCGSMFGLGASGFHLQRHRLFEASFPLVAPGECSHREPTIGVYGSHVRCRSGHYWRNTGADFPGYDKRGLAREALAIDWMIHSELSEAIPPRYAEHVGRHLMATLDWGRPVAEGVACG